MATSEKSHTSPASTGRRIRVIVAGAGSFGREHLQRLAARQDVEITGVADPGDEARDFVGKHHPMVPLFADVAVLLANTPADAVIVASPLASHVEIARMALSRGLAVLLEKPVAATAGMAAPLAALVAAGGRLLPGHVLRFSRDHRQLVDVVRSGVLGRPLFLSSRRYRDDSHASRYGDVDPILMTMIHDIDLAVWIAGSPFARVFAARSPGEAARTLTAATAITRSGVICNLRTAWTFPGSEPPADRLEVVGERGSIELVAGQSLAVHRNGRLETLPLAIADDPLANEIAHLLLLVTDHSQQPEVPLADAVEGLRLADAIARSLVSQRQIAISP